jgi:hypothetical protein
LRSFLSLHDFLELEAESRTEISNIIGGLLMGRFRGKRVKVSESLAEFQLEFDRGSLGIDGEIEGKMKLVRDFMALC